MTFLLLALTACVRVPDGAPLAGPPDLGPVDTSMRGFSWVDGRVLSAMPRPSADELHWMGAEGVEVLVTLTESPLNPESAASAGLESVHIPVEDFHAPSQEQIDQFTALVASERENGRSVGVHCLAGLGRSGTMVAAWFIHEGDNPELAITRTRSLRPGSIETQEQEESLFIYAARLRGEEVPEDSKD